MLKNMILLISDEDTWPDTTRFVEGELIDKPHAIYKKYYADKTIRESFEELSPKNRTGGAPKGHVKDIPKYPSPEKVGDNN